MIVVLSGKAGSGKDTVAEMLCKRGDVVTIALADPLKRFCAEVFDFSDDQLWGPSECRNAPDLRYRRDSSVLPTQLLDVGKQLEEIRVMVETAEEPALDTGQFRSLADLYLSPRYALQKLGTEWGRDCYPWLWISYLARVAKTLLTNPTRYEYTQKGGLVPKHRAVPVRAVVVPDARFINEIKAFKHIGAKLFRVRRSGSYTNMAKTAKGHSSETEQDSIPDSAFDAIIENNGTLVQLEAKVMSLKLFPENK